MNPKIQKLQEEFQKNADKIDSLKGKIDVLKARNKKLEREIRAEESLEIRGVLQAYSMTPDQLAAFLAAHGGTPTPKEADDEKD